MAAGEKKDDGSDPIERAMRRKEEARNASGSAKASAGQKPSSPNAPYEPLTATRAEPKAYEPPAERSFFAPNADERAEQARRAAQRVKRRVRGEEPATPATPPPRAAAPKVVSPEPEAPRRAPERVEPVISKPKAAPPKAVEPAAKPKPAVSLMDRAMSRSQPVPAQPEPSKPTPAKPARTDSLVSRASEPRAKPAAPPSVKPVVEAPVAAPKKPVLTKAERRIAEAQAARAEAAKAAQPSEPKSVLSRATEALDASGPKPSAGKTAEAAKSAAAPILEQISKAASSKPVRGKGSARSKTAPQADQTKPAHAKSAATKPRPAKSALAATPAVDPLEAAYIDAGGDEAVDSVVVVPTASLKTAKTKAFAPFEWMIASRYLRARKKEGFVSVIAGFSLLGIALGVATLIVVMAVLTGFRETLITQLLGANAHISVVSQTGNFENYDKVASEIREVDGVFRVSPLITGQVLATGPRGHSGVFLKGMRKSDLEQRTLFTSPEESEGSLADFEEDKGVAIGKDLADKLRLEVGDFISLISPDGDITPFYATPMPRKKDYKVAYIYRVGLLEVDRGHVYMPMSEAQIYLNKQGFVDQLEVFVEDPDKVEQYSDPIFQSVRSSVGLYTWKTLNGQFIAALDIERKVMFVVLTMIILVAALNIISGLVMLVKDKARGVAIMRTMGLARGSVLRIFFICGSSIGVVGSILGVILGVLFALNISSIEKFLSTITGSRLWDPDARMGISQVPSNLEFSDVALTLFIALGLSFVATLFPAWKAAKTDPVEALRYE